MIPRNRTRRGRPSRRSTTTFELGAKVLSSPNLLPPYLKFTDQASNGGQHTKTTSGSWRATKFLFNSISCNNCKSMSINTTQSVAIFVSLSEFFCLRSEISDAVRNGNISVHLGPVLAAQADSRATAPCRSLYRISIAMTAPAMLSRLLLLVGVTMVALASADCERTTRESRCCPSARFARLSGVPASVAADEIRVFHEGVGGDLVPSTEFSKVLVESITGEYYWAELSSPLPRRSPRCHSRRSFQQSDKRLMLYYCRDPGWC